jgi:type I restriction enzyme, S subunit
LPEKATSNLWERAMKKRLGDYIQEYSVRNKSGEDIPVYSITNSQGFCRDYFSKEVASKDKTTYKIVPRGCFAYNPSRINVGSVDWQRDEERVIVSPLYNVFSVSPEIDQQYLYYYLKSSATLYRIKEVATGSVRDNLRLSMLYDFMIELPSLDVQRQIVSNLDLLASIIRQRNQQLTKLDELIKARFVEMFGDPVTNPFNWPTVELGQRCEIITGNTPSRAEPENYGTFIEWIKSDNINTPSTFLTPAQEYLSEVGFQKCRFVESGSLLMTCIAGSLNCIGNVAVTNRRVAFNQQINAITPTCDNVLYLYWLMILSKPAIHKTINMALKGILSKSQLSSIKFPFPSIECQNQFAAFVAEVDKSKVEVQKALDQTQLLFDSLMQQYFG